MPWQTGMRVELHTRLRPAVLFSHKGCAMFSYHADTGSVHITTGGQTVRTSVDMGLRLWAAGTGAPRRGEGPFAVLSYAIHPDRDTGFFVCLNDSAVRHPPWPDWCPPTAPRPEWRTTPTGVWVSVSPKGACPRAVVDAYVRAGLVRDKGIAEQMQSRCDDIVRHAEEESVRDTLEYYTQCRVKRAFLRMNARDLDVRLSEVEGKLATLLVALQAAPLHAVAAWTLPSPAEGEKEDEAKEEEERKGKGRKDEDYDDPNVICLPRQADYELPVHSDLLQSRTPLD